ncbi:uncharacterized protein BXZ73DRAFT_22814, partial [Epithele typhae]|uniref:uncharacterized protein n=1 Tax=Epithele typhae TaxID=378194 RepID=UPI0020087618
YARRQFKVRAWLRAEMNESVATKSNTPGATMRYTVDDFLKQVFKRCHLVLEGWPADIPFCNLSNVGGMKNLERLAHAWTQGEMRFVPATDEHKAAAEANPMSAVPGRLNRGFRNRAQRSDVGERHYRPVTGAGYLPQPRPSQAVVTPEMEAEVDAE